MIDNHLIESICKTIERGKSVYRLLPKGGKIVMDRALPFLCVYRYQEAPDAPFARVIRTQASYLIIEKTLEIDELIKCLAATLSEKFKAFLIIELWPEQVYDTHDFVLKAPESRIPATINALKKGFGMIERIYPQVHVRVVENEVRHPRDLQPLLSMDESKEAGILMIGISVPNIYRESLHQPYPIFHRKFLAKTSEAIKRGVFEFMRVQASEGFTSHHTLGKSRLSSIVRHTDAQLAEIDQKMDFLLRITPVNERAEWENFRQCDFSKRPSFKYRLIAIDPEIEKRKLYKIRLEKIDDPTLATIFRAKRLELEMQLTMLQERETPAFRHISDSLYGALDAATIAQAEEVLNNVKPISAATDVLSVGQFAKEAEKELDVYRSIFSELDLCLEIRKDVSGIMVSKSALLINEDFAVSRSRAEALIQHEVGTHILTYCNGKSQPLRQLYAGFAGYDQLQEGLAVLAEYLVGGLTPGRLRLLAARVKAVHALQQGGSFIDAYRMLTNELGYDGKFAFNIAMRVYRGGGFSKDAIYFRGIIELLNYLRKGGDFEVLYVGKFPLGHVPFIQELIYRNILRKPVLPRHLQEDRVKKRFEKLREKFSLTDLLN